MSSEDVKLSLDSAVINGSTSADACCDPETTTTKAQTNTVSSKSAPRTPVELIGSWSMFENWNGPGDTFTKLLLEAWGTAVLTGTIILSVQTAPSFTPAAVALLLLGLIYALGPKTAAVFNPAVSIGLGVFAPTSCFTSPILPARLIFPYITSQIIGALLGGIGSMAVNASTHVGFVPLLPSIEGRDVLGVILVEAFWTHALVFVILCVATTCDGRKSPTYGIAIAATVATGILVSGPVSGAVFNPAVAVGLFLHDMIFEPSWALLWQTLILIGAQIAGAVLAGGLFVTTFHELYRFKGSRHDDYNHCD